MILYTLASDDGFLIGSKSKDEQWMYLWKDREIADRFRRDFPSDRALGMTQEEFLDAYSVYSMTLDEFVEIQKDQRSQGLTHICADVQIDDPGRRIPIDASIEFWSTEARLPLDPHDAKGFAVADYAERFNPRRCTEMMKPGLELRQWEFVCAGALALKEYVNYEKSQLDYQAEILDETYRLLVAHADEAIRIATAYVAIEKHLHDYPDAREAIKERLEEDREITEYLATDPEAKAFWGPINAFLGNRKYRSLPPLQRWVTMAEMTWDKRLGKPDLTWSEELEQRGNVTAAQRSGCLLVIAATVFATVVVLGIHSLP